MREITTGYNDKLAKVEKYSDGSYFKKGEFEIIKKRYIISGIRYWMFAEDLRQNCDNNYTTILYFTEDMDGVEDCEECSKLGKELTFLKKKYDERVLIFSVPYTMEEGIVRTLRDQYNVSDIPTLIINGQDKIEGYHTRKQIEEEIGY